jgi:hypothetical protein
MKLPVQLSYKKYLFSKTENKKVKQVLFGRGASISGGKI